MPKILIIADDLTGAADSAAAFAEYGMESVVLLRGPGDFAEPGDQNGAEVVAMDADTRGAGEQQAADSVGRIVHAYELVGADDGLPLIFKKIDSTLRGYVATELGAALLALREHASPSAHVAILLAPAFPACGRTTVNGQQLVDGRALEDSDVWREERIGARGDIAAMLAEAGLSSALLGLEWIRSEGTALEKALRANEADVVICDAESDADLDAIARAGMALDRRIIWAGSAGLARALARARALPRSEMRVARGCRARGPALFVVGSIAATSREQALALEQVAADIGVFTFTPAEVMRDVPSAETQRKAALVRNCLQQGRDALVQFDSRETCAAERMDTGWRVRWRD